MNSLTKIKISVVIPAYNEEKVIGKCLESLLQQKINIPYEIIVVNNGSSDRTEEIANSYGVRIVSEKQKGIAPARQAGFEAANGDIIVSTDADCIAPDDWLDKINQYLLDHPSVIAVGGYPIFYDSWIFKNLWTAAKNIDLLRLIKRFFGGQPLSTANLAVRRDYFFKARGFNTDIKSANGMDDVDLSLRLSELGEVETSKEIITYTSARRYVKKPWLIPIRLINALSFPVIGKGILKKGDSDVR